MCNKINTDKYIPHLAIHCIGDLFSSFSSSKLLI